VFMCADPTRAALVEARRQARCIIKTAEAALGAAEQKRTAAVLKWERELVASGTAIELKAKEAHQERVILLAQAQAAEQEAESASLEALALEELRAAQSIWATAPCGTSNVAKEADISAHERLKQHQSILVAAQQLVKAAEKGIPTMENPDMLPSDRPVQIANNQPTSALFIKSTTPSARGRVELSGTAETWKASKRQRLAAPSHWQGEHHLPAGQEPAVHTKMESSDQQPAGNNMEVRPFSPKHQETIAEIFAHARVKRSLIERLAQMRSTIDRAHQAKLEHSQMEAYLRTSRELTARLVRVSAGTSASPEEAATALRAAVGEWRHRKRLCMETLCLLQEVTRCPIEQLVSRYDVITDEACGNTVPDVDALLGLGGVFTTK